MTKDDQRRLDRIEVIEDALAQSTADMKKWAGKTWAEIEHDQEFYDCDRAIFERDVRRAIRAGLVDHPVVARWISEQRGFDGKDELRKFRAGLEKGAVRQMQPQDFWLVFEATAFADQGPEPKRRLGPEEIRRKLLLKLKYARLLTWDEYEVLLEREASARQSPDGVPEDEPSDRDEEQRQRRARIIEPWFGLTAEDVSQLTTRLEKMARSNWHRFLKGIRENPKRRPRRPEIGD